jgi:hypothetical protein
MRVWARLLGVERAIVEDVELEEVTGALAVASVPWARHGAGHTRGFDDTVA